MGSRLAHHCAKASNIRWGRGCDGPAGVDCGRTGIEFDERSIHEFPSFVSDVRSRPRKPSRDDAIAAMSIPPRSALSRELAKRGQMPECLLLEPGRFAQKGELVMRVRERRILAHCRAVHVGGVD